MSNHPPALTRREIETFELAAAKAANADEAARIAAIKAMLAALPLHQQAATEAIREARIRRGEKLRPLTKGEQAMVDELQPDDTGLHPLERSALEKETTAGHVLKALAYAQVVVGVGQQRELLQYLHPDDRSLQEQVIARHQEVADAIFALLNDSAYRSYVLREAAKLTLSSRSGGAAIYVLLEVDHDFDPQTSGKAAGAALNKLNRMAGELQVTPLEDFYGFGERDSGDWFPPEDGLRTIRALLGHLQPGSTKLTGKRAVIADLQEMAAVLQRAEAMGTRFHIEVEI